MLSCRDATELISRSMDIPLPAWKGIALRIHLLMCKFCTRYKRHLLFIREAVRRAARAEEAEGLGPVGTLSPEARRRIEEMLRGA